MPGPLPDFIVIGAMKAGTTSLYEYLRTRDDVYMPDHKEPDFFVAEKNWARGVDWYTGLFEPGRDDQLLGEASTSYTKCTEFGGVPGRIKALIPDVRLVYLLRHPIERIRSMYLHNVIDGRERDPIDVAVLEQPKYAGASSYGLQLRRYLEHFNESQILVLEFEQLRSDPRSLLGRVTDFLGLPRDHRPHQRGAHNQTSGRKVGNRFTQTVKRMPGVSTAIDRLPAGIVRRTHRVMAREVDVARGDMREETAATLVERLRPDLVELRTYLGADFHAWGLLD